MTTTQVWVGAYLLVGMAAAGYVLPKPGSDNYAKFPVLANALVTLLMGILWPLSGPFILGMIAGIKMQQITVDSALHKVAPTEQEIRDRIRQNRPKETKR